MVNSGWCSAPRSRLRKTRAKIEDARLARRQQLLAGEFRRGVQVERLAAPVRSRSASVAKACRCASLPGETCSAAGSRPRRSPRRRTSARSAAAMRPRASRKGRRSAWRLGRHQGEDRSSAHGLWTGMLSAGMLASARIRRCAEYAGTAAPKSQTEESVRGEGHRQLAAQGQCRRARRQALCRSQRPRTSIPARARRPPRSTCAGSPTG